jgi:hypothetical protein
MDEYMEGYVDLVLQLREKCNEAGLPYKYYLEEDMAPHSSYDDYYIISRQPGDERETEDNKEVSERIYLFKSIDDNEELSVASQVIGAIRNKKVFVRRLYYPVEIKDEVCRLLGIKDGEVK